jgi:hypothetical protein
MRRRVEHVFGGAGLHDASEVHDSDPVGDVPGETEVVRYYEQRHAEFIAQPKEQPQDFAADGGVQTRNRFVSDDHPRL